MEELQKDPEVLQAQIDALKARNAELEKKLTDAQTSIQFWKTDSAINENKAKMASKIIATIAEHLDK